MSLTEGLAQAVVGFGDDNPMDVVRHQAIGQASNAVLDAVVRDETQIVSSIGVVVKDLLLLIPAVSDMVPATGNNNPFSARHPIYWSPDPSSPLKKIVPVTIRNCGRHNFERKGGGLPLQGKAKSHAAKLVL